MPLTIKKSVHVAEYYQNRPEYYGLVFNTVGMDGEESTDILQASTNFTEVCPDKAEGINIPPCIGVDYTEQNGYREIKPARLIPDFSQHQLEEMYKHKGLSDLALQPH